MSANYNQLFPGNLAATLLALAFGSFGFGQTVEPAPDQEPPPRRLLMIGGAGCPVRALDRLVEWAGGKQSRILVAVWGNMAINSKLTFSWLKKTMEPLQPGEVVMAPTPDEMGNRSGQAIFREELAKATAVFFTGGDQEAIMKCIHRAGLEADLRASHRKGTVFAGNSAGTAIMSATMIVGVRERGKIAPGNVLVAQGLGLLTKGITDQHVIERQRQERLFSALLRYPGKWGLGIDEGNAVALEEGGRMEVIGTGYVMLFISSPAERSRFTVRLLEPAVYDFGELLKVQD